MLWTLLTLNNNGTKCTYVLVQFLCFEKWRIECFFCLSFVRLSAFKFYLNRFSAFNNNNAAAATSCTNTKLQSETLGVCLRPHNTQEHVFHKHATFSYVCLAAIPHLKVAAIHMHTLFARSCTYVRTKPSKDVIMLSYRSGLLEVKQPSPWKKYFLKY